MNGWRSSAFGARPARCGSYLCLTVPTGSQVLSFGFKFQALRTLPNFTHAGPLGAWIPSSLPLLRASRARDECFFPSIETSAMDDFSTISDHSMLLQGHGMFSAEGCFGTRSSSGVLSTGGKTVPALQDDRNNNGNQMFFSDWPELVGFNDDEASLRNFDPTFEMGSNYFDDILWSSNCSPEAQLVRSGYSDDIDFPIDQIDSNTTLKVNTTKTKQQSGSNRASNSGTTASNYDAHASSSSGLSDAELFLPFDGTALARQTGGWDLDGLEAILCSSPEVRVLPAASSTMCTEASSTCYSGPDTVTVRVPRSATKPKDPFNWAPDTILEEMAENPLDMYFPLLPTSGQSEMLMSDTTSSAPKHRFPEEFTGSCAMECAELQFCSEADMTSAGLLHGQQPGSSIVLDAVPVRDLSFQKLQYGVNQLDLATKGRIRDSLYRLANKLEQRHCVPSTSGGLGSSGRSNRLESDGWAETQTKHVDGLVARLLLQKPSYRKTTAPPHRVT